VPDDWFVINVAEATAYRGERGGAAVVFESPESPFPDYGISIRELQPGQPNGKYHTEQVQEDFLVLSGECIALIEGEERALRAWDFVHCPAGTEHIFVGAGDGPCHILMVGARHRDQGLHYPANELAAGYGASAAESTSVPAEAYADWSREFTETKLSWPPS
jgi:uncharacterized cupin superfamily protein